MRGRLVLAVLLLSLLLPSPAWAREVRQSMRSVCLLKSPQGSGSGFFARWEGKDVLVTNNHVILEMADVKILDVNGRTYRFDTVYTSPKRDLAIIPLERDNHDDMPNLPIHPAPDRLENRAPVTAYGDSLGDGVIVGTKGKYLGIGPEVLEVDAPFVPGNSGGPVIADRTGEVIGAATYCRIIVSPHAAATGSRFEAKRFKPSVRRFATRIDRLRLADFEKVDLEQIRQDQAAYRPIAEAYNALSNPGGYYQMQSYLAKHDPVMPDRWHTAYLRKEAYEKYRFINELRKILLPGRAEILPQDGELYRHIREAWRDEMPNIAVKTRPPLTRKCFLCNGHGKMRVDLTENAQEKRKMQSSFRMGPCSLCSQTGKLTIRPAISYAVPTAKFLQALAREIKPEDKPFCGFKIGRPIPDLSKAHPGFYRNGRFVRTGVFTVWRFSGSHQIREAAETRLWLVGDILLRADVLLPVKDRAEAQSVIDGLRREYPMLEQAELNSGLRLAADPKFEIPPPSATAKLNRADTSAAGGFPETRREPLADRYLRQLIAAAENDPFSRFYPPRSAFPRHPARRMPNVFSGGKRPVFLQISFQHKAFETCRSLIDMRREEKSFSFSGK